MFIIMVITVVIIFTSVTTVLIVEIMIVHSDIARYNKVTGVIESFPSNLKTFWKSLNLLH